MNVHGLRRFWLVWSAIFLLLCSSYVQYLHAQSSQSLPAKSTEPKTPVIGTKDLPNESELPFVQGSWTLAVLPDTQEYDKFPEIFESQTKWIAANRSKRNIAFVVHLGDIVQSDAPREWEIAKKAMSHLDGVVPYAFVTGNHDYKTINKSRDTLLNEYFPSSTYDKWPTFGGSMEAGKMENTYHRFQAGGYKWLVLALEYYPRGPTIEWANKIVVANPDHKVILVNHHYLNSSDNRRHYSEAEVLWQKLVSKHADFALVLCGHDANLGYGRLASKGDHGNVVHQILSNYQTRRLGGEGYLRLMEFLPDQKTVQVKTYSPYLDTQMTDPGQQFVFQLNELPLQDKQN